MFTFYFLSFVISRCHTNAKIITATFTLIEGFFTLWRWRISSSLVIQLSKETPTLSRVLSSSPSSKTGVRCWRGKPPLFCANSREWDGSWWVETKSCRKKKDFLHHQPLTNHTVVVLLWTRALLDIQRERQYFGPLPCSCSKVLSPRN